jgi:DNA replication and repair protein RecF
VSFAATDLALLAGGPHLRRAYLDGAAARLVPAHAETCRRYRLALQQRTRLLADLGGRRDGERLLQPWDEQLALLGSEIVHRRLDTLSILAETVRTVQEALAPRPEGVGLRYEPSVPPEAEREATRQGLLAALARTRAADQRRGVTHVGPHRDDLAVRLGRADARRDASRGEQRLLVLALRLGVAMAMRRRHGDDPVLLLDDVLSELDRDVGGRLLGWLEGQGQVIYTATDAQAGAGSAGAAWLLAEGRVEAAAAA